MKKNLLLSVLAILISSFTMAQENQFRIGLGYSSDYNLGLNLEYQSKLLNGKLAPSLTFSTLPIHKSIDGMVNYFEFGANYYFAKPGNGFYGHLSYGKTTTNYTLGSSNDKFSMVAWDINSLNARIGFKYGKKYFIRSEIGYSLPIYGYGSSIHQDFLDENTTYQKFGTPTIGLNNLQYNIGIGIAF